MRDIYAFSALSTVNTAIFDAFANLCATAVDLPRSMPLTYFICQAVFSAEIPAEIPSAAASSWNAAIDRVFSTWFFLMELHSFETGARKKRRVDGIALGMSSAVEMDRGQEHE